MKFRELTGISKEIMEKSVVYIEGDTETGFWYDVLIPQDHAHLITQSTHDKLREDLEDIHCAQIDLEIDVLYLVQ